MGERKSLDTDNGANAGIEQSKSVESGKAGTTIEESKSGDSGTAKRDGNGNGDATGGNGKSNGSDKSGGTTGNDSGGSGGSNPNNRQSGKKNNSPVKPVDLAGETANYQTDDQGRVVYKADGTPAKKRGRKPGQTNDASEKKAPAKEKVKAPGTGVEMLAAQFQILNTGIAFFTKFDDFKLDDEEALQMAKSTANVMEQFDYVPDPKVAAVLGLVTTTSMIYGPRMYLYRKELIKRGQAKSVKVERKADEEIVSEIYDFSGGNFSGLN